MGQDYRLPITGVISFYFVRHLFTFHVTASKIYSCRFDGDLCEGWKQLPHPWNNTKDDLTALRMSESKYYWGGV